MTRFKPFVWLKGYLAHESGFGSVKVDGSGLRAFRGFEAVHVIPKHRI
jgi:hypothetical protein